MFKKLAAAHQGFTLLELLIVTVIMLAVTGAAIASLAAVQSRQQALVVAKQAQQYMWIAQTKARVREVPAGCTGALQAYAVGVGNSSLQINAICPNTVPLDQYDYNFPSGVFTSAGGMTTYRFFTLERGVSTTATPPDLTLTTLPTSYGNISFCTGTSPTCASGAPIFTFTVSPLGAISRVGSNLDTTNNVAF